MKKIITCCLCFLIFTITLPVGMFSASARTTEKTNTKIISKTTEYFENGNYVTITVTETYSEAARGTAYQKNGSKSYISYDKNHMELWRFTLYATFSINPGVSVVCTNTFYDISITDDAWSNQSASTSHSGNQAVGDATFIRNVLGIPVETRNCHTILSCDVNGNLS